VGVLPNKEISYNQRDYHKVFNGTNFLQWWTQQLLPYLTEPSTIILDNAPAYHEVRHPNTPVLKDMRKAEVVAYLRSKGAIIKERRSAADLKSELKDWITANMPMEIERLVANEAGHKVLFTLPYHSDLQPIELLWARIKGYVGRQYLIDSTLTLVYQRLKDEFAAMDEEEGREGVLKYIEKTYTTAMKLYNEMDKEAELSNLLSPLWNILQQHNQDTLVLKSLRGWTHNHLAVSQQLLGLLAMLIHGSIA
jgi:transposase